MRTLPQLLTVSILFVAGTASANQGITGYSGKPYNGLPGETCKSNCHSGSGTPPTLNITVPTTIQAGQTGQVTVMIDGTRQRTSMNAAFSDGVTAKAGQNTTIPFPIETPGEVGAVTPPPAGADGTYKFTFVAPNKNGPITLWVAGMSASGAGADGDGIAAVTRTITVTGATAQPADAGSTSSSSGSSGDGGGAARVDGGGSSSSGGTGSATGASSGGDDGDDGTPVSSGGRRSSATSDEGCAAAGNGRAGGLGSSAIALGVVVAALARSRRRQRAS